MLEPSEANAVNHLASYYMRPLGGHTPERPEPTDMEAVSAWKVLLQAAADAKDGRGWGPADVITGFRPKPKDYTDYDPDQENCNSCFDLDGDCPFHQGVRDGVKLVLRGLSAIQDDPELLNGLNAAKDRMEAEKAAADRLRARLPKGVSTDA